MRAFHKARLLTDSKIRTRAQKIVSASGFRIEAAAKKAAPVNFGRLRDAIVMTKPDPFTARVTAGVNYAEFVEKGRQPGKFPPLGPIKLWATRVLGNPGAAFAIARKIAMKGTKAQPFLGPALKKEKPTFIKNLRTLFK